MVREDVPGRRRLVAYVVAEEGAALGAGGAARAPAGRGLPEHMVPSAIVLLERVAADRQRQGGPAGAARLRSGAERRRYVAPRTRAEEVLARDLGGGAAPGAGGGAGQLLRAGRRQHPLHPGRLAGTAAGLLLTPRQLFEHPTVARLAAWSSGWRPGSRAASRRAGCGGGSADADPAALLRAAGPRRRHHFNQSLLLQPREALDPGCWHRGLAACWRTTTRCGCASGGRVAGGGSARGGRGAAASGSRGPVGAAGARAGRPRSKRRRSGCRRAWTWSGAAAAGGALPARREESERLLLVVHHLVVDGRRWRILLEDLESAYRQLSRGEAVRLPEKTTSFQQLGGAPGGATPRSRRWREEAAYWRAAGRAARGRRSRWTTPGARRRLETRPGVSRAAERGGDGGAAAGGAAGVPDADQRRAAGGAGACAGGWTGERRVRVDLEGHGREEELFGGRGRCRARWGGSPRVYPVRAGGAGGRGRGRGAEGGQGAAARGAEAGDRLRGAALPGGRPGIGSAGGAGAGGGELQLSGAARPERLGGEGSSASAPRVGGSDAGRAGAAGAPCWTCHGCGVGGAPGGGAGATARSCTGARRWRRWRSGYAAELRGLIAHCRSAGAGGYTPSDFPPGHGSGARRTLDALLGSAEATSH